MVQEIIVYIIGLSVVAGMAFRVLKIARGKTDACSNCKSCHLTGRKDGRHVLKEPRRPEGRCAAGFETVKVIRDGSPCGRN